MQSFQDIRGYKSSLKWTHFLTIFKTANNVVIRVLRVKRIWNLVVVFLFFLIISISNIYLFLDSKKITFEHSSFGERWPRFLSQTFCWCCLLPICKFILLILIFPVNINLNSRIFQSSEHFQQSFSLDLNSLNSS